METTKKTFIEWKCSDEHVLNYSSGNITSTKNVWICQEHLFVSEKKHLIPM